MMVITTDVLTTSYKSMKLYSLLYNIQSEQRQHARPESTINK